MLHRIALILQILHNFQNMLSAQSKLRIGGAIWFIGGCFLMNKGVHLLLNGTKGPLLSSIATIFGGVENGAIVLMVFALLLGYVKGSKVLSKLVDREASRLQEQKEPNWQLDIYSRRQVIILALMVMIGVSIRFVGMPADIHGVIDMAIGAALIHGSMHYFRRSRKSTCDTGCPS